MTEDDNEGHIQFGDRVLNAALDRRAGAASDIAGDTDDKDVAHAHIEADLWRDPGIGAADDDGIGILTFREGAKILGTAPRSSGLAFRETRVALKEVVQRLVGADGQWVLLEAASYCAPSSCDPANNRMEFSRVNPAAVRVMNSRRETSDKRFITTFLVDPSRTPIMLPRVGVRKQR